MSKVRSKFQSLAKCTGAAAILLLLSSAALAQTATVTTDKPDYAPGETVIITGTGWQPGETVLLLLHEEPNHPCPDRQYTAVADASGNFTNTEFSPTDHDFGVTFTLTATGQSSGFTAETTFTDGTFHWVGCESAAWDDKDNWASSDVSCTGSVPSSNTVPAFPQATADAVEIRQGNGPMGFQYPVLSTAVTLDKVLITGSGTNAGKLTVAAGGSLTVNNTEFKLDEDGDLVMTGGVVQGINKLTLNTSNNSITQSGGNFRMTGEWNNKGTFSQDPGGSTATVEFASGSNVNGWPSGPSASNNGFNHVQINSGAIVNFDANASKTISVKGNWTNNGTASMTGSNPTTIVLDGPSAQTIGGTATTTFWRLNVSKPAGTSATLAQNANVANLLSVLSGTFDHGASFNLSTATNGGITVSAGATYRDVGTGALTLGSGSAANANIALANAGSVQINGVTTACGEADSILIRSTADGTSRTWSGTGTFDLQDVDIRRQTKSGTAITVYSGTDSLQNVGFTFQSCPAVCGNGIVEGAEQCDSSSCCTASCTYQAEFTACGSADATACNAPDSCNATGSCVDRKDAAGSVCLAGSGACDPDDVCDGATDACAPVFAAAGAACGDSSDTECTNPDSCDGSGACQVNNAADGSTCGDADAECTNQDTCSAGACTDNGFKAATTACGSQADTACDNPNTCSGNSAACLDNFEPVTAACGDAEGACVNADSCDGSGSCTDNGFKAEFTACGDSDGTACNAADSCDTAGTCVDRKDAAGTVCLAAGADATCDPADTCDGTTNTCEPVYAAFGVSCGDSSDTECTNPDSCDGSGACQANNSAEGSSCGDAGSDCVNRDTCSAGSCIDNGFKPATTACGSQADTACDNPNTCSGDSAACLDNFEPTTTACGDAEGACTNADSCNGSGSCTDNGFKAEFTACGDSDGTACNAADSCDASGTCLDRKDPAGSLCLAGSGACDPDDVCDGTTNTCAPVYAAAGSACGDADGECTNADSCNATGTCVDNGFKPSTTTCGDAGDGICDTQDTCSGDDGSCVDRVADAGTACGDGSDTDCTNPDTCDSSGSCQVNHEASGTSCDDEDACTTTDLCDAGGECAGTSDPVCAGCTGNTAPVFVTVTATPSDPQPYSNGNANVMATFTDAPGIHQCTINWGDESANDVFNAQDEPTLSDPIGSCTGSHLYTAVGVYEVTITVSDGCTSGSATTVYQYFVLYDPNGGFVTGGGWINSPAGAYPANPDLTGKANFGFVSKYQKNATTPTGNTQFHFNAAGFKFDSDSYEWLVISGAKARYRGVGQVNGQGSYGFELTAWDGQAPGGGGSADRFRIKIWDHNQGNGVVYDNMMGAGDGEDPTTELGGGSIVIHKK